MNASTTSTIVLREEAGNQPPHLDPVQQFLAPYVNQLSAFWFSVWCMTAIVLVVKVFLEYKARSRHDE